MLGQSFRRRQTEPRRHLEYCRSHLDQLNPLAILQRGYAVATLLPQGTVIRDATLVLVRRGRPGPGGPGPAGLRSERVSIEADGAELAVRGM